MFTAKRIKKRNCCGRRRKNCFCLNMDFFRDFCITKNSSLLLIPKLNELQKQPSEVFCKKRCSYTAPATLLKKRLWHRCFPVNFAKFLRTPFWQNFSGRLLLELAVKENCVEKTCGSHSFFLFCLVVESLSFFSRLSEAIK